MQVDTGTDYIGTEKGNFDLQTLKKVRKIACNIELSHDNVNLALTFTFHTQCRKWSSRRKLLN